MYIIRYSYFWSLKIIVFNLACEQTNVNQVNYQNLSANLCK